MGELNEKIDNQAETEGNGGRTYSQAEFDAALKKASDKAAAALRRQMENKDTPHILELQNQVADLTEKLESEKAANAIRATKIENLAKEKAELAKSVDAEKKNALTWKAETALASELAKYQFTDPAVVDLLATKFKGALAVKTDDKGALVVEIDGKPLGEAVKAYVDTIPKFVQGSLQGGPGAKGSQIGVGHMSGSGDPVARYEEAKASGAWNKMDSATQRTMLSEVGAALEKIGNPNSKQVQ